MVIEWQWTPSERASKALVKLAAEAAAGGPEQPINWINLASLVTLVRGHRDALDVLAEAIGHCPDDAELRFMAAQAHFAMGHYERGLEHCAQALQLAPGHERAQLLRSSLLVKTTGLEAAKPLLNRAAAANLSDSYVLEYMAAQLSEPGVAEQMLECCNRALAENPRSVQPLYFKALALAKLGDARAARATLPLDRVVAVSTPDTLRGYDAPEAFRAALADEILNHPSLRNEPRGKSTSGGSQTDTLREHDGPALAAFFRLVRNGVESYVSAVADPSQSGAPPTKCALQLWATVLGPRGKQDAHRHPDGWLSGVYYVEAPWSEQEQRYCGDLLVGIVDEAVGIAAPWEVRRIEPVPGCMVIFPSNTPHATEPSNAPGQRISLAFDVIRID